MSNDDYTELSEAAQVEEELRQRLSSRLRVIREFMRDGRWYTIEEVAAHVGAPAQGVGAQMRDLRKPKYGAHAIEGKRHDDDVFRYRMVPGSWSSPVAEPAKPAAPVVASVGNVTDAEIDAFRDQWNEAASQASAGLTDVSDLLRESMEMTRRVAEALTMSPALRAKANKLLDRYAELGEAGDGN